MDFNLVNKYSSKYITELKSDHFYIKITDNDIVKVYKIQNIIKNDQSLVTTVCDLLLDIRQDSNDAITIEFSLEDNDIVSSKYEVNNYTEFKCYMAEAMLGL